ncbi:M48 family metalloprotease [Plectonema cf. radiosum LEGE 06105]|uniref:M48 family metalloprotease n=1 Tax=Plectonema cf. radiosum LEGE 06105 TaxID=945769 RepID=A0A8J7FEG2_9CYAN|nr:M48 family metalloprotease [Plectonema radiosum]MBE9216054.1 M48 family metalloprotease [Plectonema cf. radiosum LEGE 06105]
MKRQWKSLILALNWVLLSLATSVLIILTQSPQITIAQPPAVIIKTPEKETLPDTDKQKPESSTEESTDKKPEEEAKPTPEEIARQKKLIEADKLYQAGNITEAQTIYRQAKQPFANTSDIQPLKQPIVDPAKLSPAGKVYWREAQAGIISDLRTRTLVPLELLVEKYPEFIPGNIKYAEALKKYGQNEKALEILERATSLYPNQAELVQVRVDALSDEKQWMQASLAARQFALLNPEHPQAKEFTQIADEKLKKYTSYIRRETRGNAIANIITGVVGYAATGSLLGPFSALDSTMMLLKGEEGVGRSVAKQAKKQLQLIEDKEVNTYINDIGQKLAKIAGRDEFEYEFFVIPEESLNAFALPGGKIFLNAGAIAKTNSEAEIAGLIGHELSHTVLSHGFQLVTQANLISNVTQYIPLGGTVGRILTFDYSRDMERQADRLGTRLLTAGGYAADGLRNLMVTMKNEQKNAPPVWLSTHPGGGERVRYLETLITTNGYNRYAYEGVASHQKIKDKVKQIIKERKDKDKEEDNKKEEKNTVLINSY